MAHAPQPRQIEQRRRATPNEASHQFCMISRNHVPLSHTRHQALLRLSSEQSRPDRRFVHHQDRQPYEQLGAPGSSSSEEQLSPTLLGSHEENLPGSRNASLPNGPSSLEPARPATLDHLMPKPSPEGKNSEQRLPAPANRNRSPLEALQRQCPLKPRPRPDRSQAAAWHSPPPKRQHVLAAANKRPARWSPATPKGT